jgi:acyl-CoA thioester hydrolase
MKHFECIIPLRWGDMDAFAHLNNTLYFRLIEEARIQWFMQLGLNVSLGDDGPILAHASCDFIKPMTYPGTAKVIQDVVRVGRSSVQVDCMIENLEQPGFAWATCKSVIVWMDYRAGKSAPWPDEVRKMLE